MGEIVQVDADLLRSVADRVRAAADQIGDVHWPGLDPDALRGSAVGAAATAAPAAAQLQDVVADLRGWALAARDSAEALERADRAHRARIGG